MKNKSDRKKLKNDIIFISCLLLFISVVACCCFFFRNEGNTVMVTVAGKFYGEFSLHEDRTVEIRTETSLNVFVIREGKVYMEIADCPDGICTKHRAVSYDGESIICLPNQVVIAVDSKNEDSPDIVA